MSLIIQHELRHEKMTDFHYFLVGAHIMWSHLSLTHQSPAPGLRTDSPGPLLQPPGHHPHQHQQPGQAETPGPLPQHDQQCSEQDI